MWIDTHCHLDALPEFYFSNEKTQKIAVDVAQTAIESIAMGVIPGVGAGNWQAVRHLAHQLGWAYALGTHPMFTPQAGEADAQALEAQLDLADPQLVAVGEIGLDLFVQELKSGAAFERQWRFYKAQLQVAKRAGLPVILHVRKSADLLLKGLREQRFTHGGIAHAFNGSVQQAQTFIDMGFKLGFGGALTFEGAHQLRRLATELPLEAIVLETDAPDIPPQWLYVKASDRAQGTPQAVNTPSELPRIGQVLAELRGIERDDVRQATSKNASAALPRLGAWMEHLRAPA